MLNEPQMKPIAEALLRRTQKGEVKWSEGEANDSGTAYIVKLSKAGILLKWVTPIAEPDYLILALLDEKGAAALAWQVDEPEPSAVGQEVANWELLHSLFVEARREATGWDKVLKEVETALAGQGPIGIASSRK